MTARSRKSRQSVGDMFPGMADRIKMTPPKAEAEPEALTLDEAIARSFAIYERVLAAFPVVATIGLFSGGNDSVVVNHLFRHRVDAIAHVNTGTGIRETTQHVRDVATAWHLPLHELRPKHSYADLVMGRVLSTRGKNIGRQVWKGFPGPAGHGVMYRRLKDEPLQRLRAELVGRGQWRTRNAVYLSGMRWAETNRRFRNAEEVDREGSLIWVSPIVHWTDAHMREYRARHRCTLPHQHAAHLLCTPGALPLNEVTVHLHMSGECLCGAFAKPGELDEIEFFYPQAAKPLRELERQAQAVGLSACKWGRRPPGARKGRPAGRLCSKCDGIEGQSDLLAEWRTSGLITESQYDTFTRQDVA